MVIPLKSEEEIQVMRQAGQIGARVMGLLKQMARPGLETRALDRAAQRLIEEAGAEPSFRGYQGFPAHIVTCLNEEIVHAIPSKRKLKTGDLLTIDLGIFYHHLHVDMATTFEIVESSLAGQKFLAAGEAALQKAIQECRPGNQIGDISAAIQGQIEKEGYHVVRSLVGHGVGHELHEEPQIPCFGEPDTGPLLRRGMVLAVEVMYMRGRPETKVLEDGWTIITRDGSLAAMFEHTVAVSQEKPLILTAQML